jgi:hypothetical protein
MRGLYRIVAKCWGLGIEIGRVDGFDIREPLEVALVEGENALDAVNMHGCHEASIVDLNAGDAVINEYL